MEENTKTLRNPVAGRFLTGSVGRKNGATVHPSAPSRPISVPCSDGTAPRPHGARGGTSGDGIGDKHGPSSWLDLIRRDHEVCNIYDDRAS